MLQHAMDVKRINAINAINAIKIQNWWNSNKKSIQTDLNPF